jgi:hypothetical protein
MLPPGEGHAMTCVRLLICGALAAPVLAGCETPTPGALPGVPVEQVVREIKYELEDYRQYERAHANDPALNNACKGKLDFQITNVRARPARPSRSEPQPCGPRSRCPGRTSPPRP